MANVERNKGKEAFFKVALALAIIGALNWGLIGLFNFNLVDAIFGGGAKEETSAFSRLIYVIVGLCGALSTYFLSRRGRLAPELERGGAGAGISRPTEVRP